MPKRDMLCIGVVSFPARGTRMDTDNSNRIATYSDFFPFYLGEHRNRVARGLHYFGTTFSAAILLYALLEGAWSLIPLAFVAGYGPAWIGHFFFEKNRPATFTYPLWSLRGDYHMFFLWVTGQLKRRLQDSSGPKAGLAE